MCPKRSSGSSNAILRSASTKEAKDNAAVLGYNYPGSRWYGDAYALVTGGSAPAAASEGWFGRLVSNVF